MKFVNAKRVNNPQASYIVRFHNSKDPSCVDRMISYSTFQELRSKGFHKLLLTMFYLENNYLSQNLLI